MMSDSEINRQSKFPNESIALAIVIPYYKKTYFRNLLEALATQTNKNFRVYIGNDDSPTDPVDVIKEFSTQLDITYRRFDERLGGKFLTRQWDRCVGMIRDEPWVWVLPDDDLPSDNVVDEFYAARQILDEKKINVVRLPQQVINATGIVLQDVNDNPVIETNYEFYSRLLRGKTSASLGDNIFRRSALELSGGFVELPKAWGSDHATILNVAANGLIFCLQNARLGFRMSGENISSKRDDGREKISARIMFANWLKDNHAIFANPIDDEFFKNFYWKGEYYAVNQFTFSFMLWWELYKLRRLCVPNLSLLPFVKLLVKQLFIDKVIASKEISR